MKNRFQYIYGPVFSWRLGASLGLDPLAAEEKVCNFDCVYCQLGRTVLKENERRVFVPTESFIEEIQSLPPVHIDYLTFSGKGEPTLASNLGEMIRALRKVRKEKIAVITNSSLMYRRDVQEDLMAADFVIAKLDACSQETFSRIDRALNGLDFSVMVAGIKDFRTLFRGKLALQIMFIGQNRPFVPLLAKLAEDINPDQVELNTPLRPSAVKPLSKKEMDEIKPFFKNFSVVSVYDVDPRNIDAWDEKETMLRHGQYKQNPAEFYT